MKSEQARAHIYRHEWKYEIPYAEMELTRRRLEPFLQPDPHAAAEGYSIRSLYFDDWKNSAYDEKLMGVMQRRKWRIRVYNCSDASIRLERKIKQGSYIFKESAALSRAEYEQLLDGSAGFLLEREENLCKEFYYEYTVNLWRPKVIVDYERLPMILDAGTVRITFDQNVRAAFGSWDLFDASLPTLPAMDADRLILEVKFTEFLPGMIEKLLPSERQAFTAVSKYTLCCDAAHHLTDPRSALAKSHLGWKESK